MTEDPANRPLGTDVDDRGAGAQRRRIWLVLGCAIPAAVAIAILVAGSGSNDSSRAATLSGSSTPPASLSGVQAGSVSEVWHYDDLAQMQATSDLVVRGHVVKVQPGRTIGDKPASDAAAVDEYTSGGAIQFNEVVLNVDEWLGGKSEVKAGDELVLEEEAPIPALAPSSQAGDSGVYFVMEKGDRPGAFVLSGSPARFLQTTDPDKLLASNPDIDWAAKAAAQSLNQLVAQIKANQTRIEQGEVKPAPSPFG